MSSDDRGTGARRRAPAQPRDTPEHLFSLILELQRQHYTAEGLMFALARVLDDLHDTPGTSRHPAVMSAQALAEALTQSLADQLDTLERLEMSRFSGERGAV